MSAITEPALRTIGAARSEEEASSSAECAGADARACGASAAAGAAAAAFVARRARRPRRHAAAAPHAREERRAGATAEATTSTSSPCARCASCAARARPLPDAGAGAPRTADSIAIMAQFVGGAPRDAPRRGPAGPPSLGPAGQRDPPPPLAALTRADAEGGAGPAALYAAENPTPERLPAATPAGRYTGGTIGHADQDGPAARRPRVRRALHHARPCVDDVYRLAHARSIVATLRRRALDPPTTTTCALDPPRLCRAPRRPTPGGGAGVAGALSARRRVLHGRRARTRRSPVRGRRGRRASSRCSCAHEHYAQARRRSSASPRHHHFAHQPRGARPPRRTSLTGERPPPSLRSPQCALDPPGRVAPLY